VTPVEKHLELCKKYGDDSWHLELWKKYGNDYWLYPDPLEPAIEAFIASKVRERDLADDEILRAREDLRSLSHPSLIEAE